jgi:hypothetical protein
MSKVSVSVALILSCWFPHHEPCYIVRGHIFWRHMPEVQLNQPPMKSQRHQHQPPVQLSPVITPACGSHTT